MIEAALRRALADTFVFYFKAHVAHWNVTGSDFAQYHAFLDTLWHELFDAIDELAEHLRSQRFLAPFALDALVDEASVPEYATAQVEPLPLFSGLLEANDLTIASLNAAFAEASAANEQGLCNFLAERLDVHAKHGWMLRSILGSRQ